jgi:hypothetical protein
MGRPSSSIQRSTRPSTFARSRRFRAQITRTFEVLEGRALLSTLFALTNQDTLVSFSSTVPGTISSTVAISGLSAGEAIVGIDIQPSTGQVFGLGSASHLYTINLVTGKATAVSSTPFSPALSGTQFGFDLDPVTNLLRVVDDSGQNFRLDPTTGSVIGPDTTPAYISTDPNKGVTPDLVTLAYTGIAGSSTTTAYSIDARGGTHSALLVQLGTPSGTPDTASTGMLTTVGSLGFSISDAVGFDIDTLTNTAYAILSPASGSPPSGPALYTINLNTGVATPAGSLGSLGTASVIGLAISTLSPPVAPTLSPASDSGSSNSDHVTNVKTPVILGSALPSALINILANGVIAGQGNADSSGNYAITLSPLADGSYIIQAVQTTTSGLSSSPSLPLTPKLVIETSAPAPSTPILLTSDDTGFSHTDNFTRVRTPTFVGTGEAGDTVNLYTNGFLIGQATVAPNGVYVIQSFPLIDGVYQITATETDIAGNTSPTSGPVSPPFTIDTTTKPTPQQAYVGQLYQDLLGRPADLGGLNIFIPKLDLPNGRAVIVSSILISPEYRNHVVTQDYEKLLGRNPTSTELTTGANYFSARGNESLEALIAGGNEFYQKAGGTVPTFLAALYRDFLGRSLDAGGQAYFTSLFNAGVSTTSVAYDVITSNEGYSVIVNGYSLEFLNRVPDLASVAAAVATLKAGGNDSQIIIALATSNEAFAVAQGSTVVINQWLKQVSLDLTGQALDPSTQATLATQLAQGTTTPAQVVQSILNGQTYRTAVVTRLYQSILGHSPDPVGLAAETAYLAAGGTIEGLKVQLYGSQEYYIDAGGPNTAYISALYNAILGRPVDSATLSTDLTLLSNGLSRASLVAYLLFSPEGTQQTVQSIYLTYLRRLPTFGESSALSAQLQPGAITDQAIIAILVVTPEYFTGL